MAGQATERRARGIQWTWDVSKLEDESERTLYPLEAIKVMYFSDEGLQVIVRRNQRKLRELVKGELDRRRFTLVWGRHLGHVYSKVSSWSPKEKKS
jgi:hypothetical protein